MATKIIKRLGQGVSIIFQIFQQEPVLTKNTLAHNHNPFLKVNHGALGPTLSPTTEVPRHFNQLTILTTVGWHYGFFAVHEGFAFAERVGFDA